MRLIADQFGAKRGGETIFSDVSFELGSGDGLVVTGPNGAGKSTLLRALAGLLPTSEGAIRLEGGTEDFPTIAAACHYLGHENGMKKALTVFENLAFWREFLGSPHLAIDEALEMVGLDTIGHLPFGYLSTGQKRRIAIARLLVSYRPLWLLDEPTSGLDKHSEMQFIALMKAHLEDGGMIIAATHLPLGLDGVAELRLGERH
jgi:heme exporter protein A